MVNELMKQNETLVEEMKKSIKEETKKQIAKALQDFDQHVSTLLEPDSETNK
jgi:F0F1-type ATP synthase membrane subunit b/b'